MGIRERLFGFENSATGISLEFTPIDTAPDSEALLLQPEARFDVKYQIQIDGSYSGTLEFRTPDPFVIKNRARPDSLEWNSNDQIVSANEAEEDDRIQMKVVFPSKYRGKKSGQIEIIEQSNKGEKLLEYRMMSDPPLIHTQS
jgi:hypothetical protein